ncbi:hypothetical protein FF098_012460 [Parvularcula flava]|uniref:Uncharacterized protein n=1 Tax=Aquisalinus luteolus TaxID=1566827 RepID=A0A8J3A4G3_9PROT|nr:hypothetical protein [Aquisalinus luteolus]NHK28724.1 hypothetical protein [Aquisalinus luteolus]GGH99326.1 hypothetical protein GCM10011355_25020 [Aquisalinus luteolus]
MSEAEVAQQLIADLQANFGVISAFIIILLLGGLLALGTTLNNASRAMRELQESASAKGSAKGKGSSPQMAYGMRETAMPRDAGRFAAKYAAPSRPIGRELPLARKSASRHVSQSMSGSATGSMTGRTNGHEAHRRPRRTGDRHSLI